MSGFGIVGKGGTGRTQPAPTLVDKVFDTFVGANKMKREAAFGAGISYTGLSYTRATKEDLVKTPDFLGFCEGYFKKPHRFPEGRDMLDDIQQTLSRGGQLRTISLASLAPIQELVRDVASGDETKRLFLDGLAKAHIDNTDVDKYAAQYQLARAYGPR